MSKHIVKQTEWAICYCDNGTHLIVHEMSSEQANLALKRDSAVWELEGVNMHKVKITKYIEVVKGY